MSFLSLYDCLYKQSVCKNYSSPEPLPDLYFDLLSYLEAYLCKLPIVIITFLCNTRYVILSFKQ